MQRGPVNENGRLLDIFLFVYDSAAKCISKIGGIMTTESETEILETKPEYIQRQLYDVPIKDLHPDFLQPRKCFDKEDGYKLEDSIRCYGVIQPIIFRRDEDSGKLYVIAGERRYRAAKKLGHEDIPAIFMENNTAEIALIENLQRVDLTVIDEAEALLRIKNKWDYNNVSLGRLIGKAESTVSEILKINQLPLSLRKKYRGEKALSKRILLEVVKAPSPEEMEKLLDQMLNKGKTRDEVRAARITDTKGPDACRSVSNRLAKVLSILDLENVAADKRPAVEKSLSSTLEILADKLGYQLVKQQNFGAPKLGDDLAASAEE